MRWANRVVLSVFCSPEEDFDSVRSALLALVPFECGVHVSKAQGFNERMIRILRLELLKQGHTSQFLKHFVSLLSSAQKDLLSSQLDSRVDDRLDFFVRIDKRPWVDKRKLFLTDSGDCFHVRVSLACFPRKRDVALKLAEAILHS